MKYFKLLIQFLLICSCLTASGIEPPSGKSVFSQRFSNILFRNAEDAFNAYQGYWSGAQRVSIERANHTTGKLERSEMMSATVDQRYLPVGTSIEPKLLGSGSINAEGNSIPTRCYVYLKGDKLLLEIQTADKRIVKYEGTIDGNSVIWFPLYKFANYDFQRDSFFRNDKGVSMVSSGSRYIKIPAQNIEGMIIVETVLQQNDSSYTPDKANLYDGTSRLQHKKSSFGN